MKTTTRAIVLAPCLLLAGLLTTGGCASTLTDELALTAAKTREPSVRATERLAETLERLPRTLDELNRLLGEGVKAAHEAGDPERGLAAGAARVTSSTAGAIDRVGELVATMDRVGGHAARLLEDTRRESDDTRGERLRIMANVTEITSSVQTLVGRVEEVSRDWNDHARELRAHESRATKALADLSESTARASDDISRATAAFAKLTTNAEPQAESATKSLAAILADVARITNRVSSDEATSRTAVAFDLVVGALAGLAVILIVLGIRVSFRRAVEAAVTARLGGAPPPD